jgi:tRNA A-37 threonylcarbamoyl transferase component Bud32
MTPADLQRIAASPGWRQHRVELLHDTSVGSVIVKGQRPPRPTWRYGLLNGLARLLGLPLLKAAPAYGGARAQQLEVERLRRLAEAGAPVPELLHVDTDYFVQRWAGPTRLDQLLLEGDALRWWQRGLRTLVDLHARDQYLSQAFARNFIASGEALTVIDFEDDPLEAMTLPQAQARDWLAYLHSSARALRSQNSAQRAEAIALLRAELARERPAVRQLVAATARKLRWVLRLSAGNGRGWRRHVAILHAAVELMLAAEPSDDNPAGPNPATARR